MLPGIFTPINSRDYCILQDGSDRGVEAAVSNSPVGKFYRSFGGILYRIRPCWRECFSLFLGKPEPGVVSLYEAVFIWVLFPFGAILQILSVMNDKYRNKIRIGVGGILFVISILLPKLLDSYALVRATCAPPLPEDTSIKAQCETQAIGTIPVFTMAIAFSTALMVLFFVSMLSPTIERFISWLTGDGTNARESGSLSDSLEGAQNQQNLPGQELETAVLPSSAEPPASVAQRHSSRGSFAAAVLGGAVVWTIQAIGIRMTKHR